MFSNFLKGLFTGVIAFVVKTGLNILVVPLLIKYLGITDYGFYLLLLNFSEMLVLMDVGLTTGLTQRISYFHAHNDPESIKKQLFSAIWLYLAIAVLIVLSGALTYQVIPELFHIAPQFKPIASLAFFIVFGDAAVNLIGTYFQAILKAHCLHKRTNVVEAGQSILNNLLTLVMVIMHFGLIQILLARLAVSGVILVIYILMTIKSEPLLLQAKRGAGFRDLKELFDISIFAMLQKVSVIIAHRIDEVIIGIFLTLTDVGVYGLVLKIFANLTGFSIKLMEGVFPVFTRLSSKKDNQASRLFFVRISSFTCFVLAALIFIIFINYPEIVQFMSSGKVAFQETLPLAAIVAVFCWNGALQYPAGSYLFSSGAHRLQTYIYLVTAVANLILSLSLVKVWGMIGIALGTLIPHLVQINFFTIRLTCKHIELPFLEYIREVYLRNVFPLLSVALGLCGSRFLFGWEHPTTIPMIICSGICMVAGTILWFQTTASPIEKEVLGQRLTELKQKLTTKNQGNPVGANDNV